MDAYDQADALHSSEELVMNDGGRGLNSLPFNFTLSARHANGPASLSFGFENLDGADGFVRGELGFRTEFAFRDGKLINGNRALGYHVARIFPPWTSLWSLKGEVHSFLEFIAISRNSGGRPNHFLEFVRSGKFTSTASISFPSSIQWFEGANWWFLIERSNLWRLRDQTRGTGLRRSSPT